MPIGTASNMEWLQGPGGSGTVEYTAGDGIVIDNTNHVISTDQTTVQDKLTAGEGITIQNNVISADQVQSDWTELDSSVASYIQHKPPVKNLIAGNGISITETAQGIVISLAEEIL